ncbi:MAG: class I SAM-dependent methyltransferase [Micromonosporaceae bacterium]
MAPTAAYDEIADWYEHEFLSGLLDDPIGVDSSLRELLGAGGGRCLEIGCGTGVHAATLAELGWTPYGVDLSERMLRYAANRLPVARTDAERLPVAEAAVDAVAVVMVHTDMPGYPAVLRERRGCCAPAAYWCTSAYTRASAAGSPTVRTPRRR